MVGTPQTQTEAVRHDAQLAEALTYGDDQLLRELIRRRQQQQQHASEVEEGPETETRVLTIGAYVARNAISLPKMSSILSPSH